MVPKATLERSCNAVLNTFVPALLQLFLSKLADDYVKWSGDAGYRWGHANTTLPAPLPRTAQCAWYRPTPACQSHSMWSLPFISVLV